MIERGFKNVTHISEGNYVEDKENEYKIYKENDEEHWYNCVVSKITIKNGMYYATATIFQYDIEKVEGNTNISASDPDHTIDEVINDAKNFLNIGQKGDSKIDTSNLKSASNTLYNMLLALAIVLAVSIGIYLGMKFMVSSVEDKAKVKESLIPYIAGCVVIFGAFIIWKLALIILNGIA